MYFCRTHLTSRSSELMVEEADPINKIAMGPDGLLWCATTGSTARCYDVGGFTRIGGGLAGGLPPVSPRTPSRAASGKIFHAGPSPQVRHRQRLSRLSLVSVHDPLLLSFVALPLRQCSLAAHEDCYAQSMPKFSWRSLPIQSSTTSTHSHADRQAICRSLSSRDASAPVLQSKVQSLSFACTSGEPELKHCNSRLSA